MRDWATCRRGVWTVWALSAAVATAVAVGAGASAGARASAALAGAATQAGVVTQAQIADSKLETEMKKLVQWVNHGTMAQRRQAALAIRLSPESAYPIFEAAAKDGTIAPEVKAFYTGAMENLTTARQRRHAAIAEEREWVANGIAAYDAHGKRDPKWDEDARALFAYAPADLAYPEQKDSLMGLRHARAALKAQCADPIVRYLIFSTMKMTAPIALRLQLANEAAKSEYPTSWKLVVCAWALEPDEVGNFPHWNSAALPEIKALVTVAEGLLPGLETEKPPEARSYGSLTYIGTAMSRASSVQEALAKIEPLAKKLLSSEGDQLTVSAMIHFNAASDIRGKGYTSTVDPQNWGTIESNWAATREGLEKAVEVDPHNALASRLLAMIGKGLGYDQEQQADHFRKALESNPDNTSLLAPAMDGRATRWGGEGLASMLEYPQAAALSRNYAGNVPQAAIKLWRRAASMETDPGEFYAWFQKPEMVNSIRFSCDDAVKLDPRNETLMAAFDGYSLTKDCKRRRAVLMQLPDEYEAVGLFRESWSDLKPLILGETDAKDNGAPESRPAWAP